MTDLDRALAEIEQMRALAQANGEQRDAYCRAYLDGCALLRDARSLLGEAAHVCRDTDALVGWLKTPPVYGLLADRIEAFLEKTS